jgi:GcrA cell cycle regulator
MRGEVEDGGGRVKRSAPQEAPPKSRYLTINAPTVIYLPRQHKPPDWVVNAIPYADDPLADADIPLRERRSLLRLNHRTCRWPVGDPGSRDFFFCGAEPLKDKPYCEAHCARARRRPKRAARGASGACGTQVRHESRSADTLIEIGDEGAGQARLMEDSK